MNSRVAPYALNLAMTAFAVAMAAAQLWLVPLLLLPQVPAAAIAIVLLVSLATPFHSALIHEAVHGRLARRPALSDGLGRALGICNGVSFDLLRFGHMSHHRYNRHKLDRPDLVEAERVGPVAVAAYYLRLLGGAYLVEVGATLAGFLPRPLIHRVIDRAMAGEEAAMGPVRDAAQRAVSSPKRLLRIRADAVMAIVAYGVAFWLYGAWWPLLVAGIAVRGIILSVQDNAPHYGTAPVINAPALNGRMPRWAAPLMLHQNLHAVHHDRPDLPWTALPEAFEAERKRYHGAYPVLMAQQFKGPMTVGDAAERAGMPRPLAQPAE